MPDETFQAFAERVLREHDARMARYDQLHEEHATRMARLDRQYDKLLQVAADVAATNDRLEIQMQTQTRMQRDLQRLIEETREMIVRSDIRITQNEAMLRILIDIQRNRNGDNPTS